MKKIAIVHDYIKEYGGAERVLEVLHEMYPQAPIFTLIYAPQFLGPHKERFSNWNIKPSFLQKIPFSYKFISLYRLIAPFAFKTFDFSGFDAVLVSATGAYSPNTIKKEEAIQICYCHTPPRYLYGFATSREAPKNPIVKILLAIALHILRMVDFASSKNVDKFIANSKNVAARIQKFYRRDSVVIYPPVNIPNVFVEEKKAHSQNSGQEEYFLTGGRLARPKHVDLIVKACKQLGVSLKVFGRGFAGYEQELMKISNIKYPISNIEYSSREQSELRSFKNSSRLSSNNIEFLGEVSDEEKYKLMRKARAFIFASEDEDFGIVPVEAMSVGTPVIAYKSGGVVESVVDGKTGLFFDELSVRAIMDAINKFGKTKISQQDCYKQSEKFSKEVFIREIDKIVRGNV